MRLQVLKLKWLSLILAFFSGCGKDGAQDSLAQHAMANQTTVDDLAFLLKQYPEFSPASLGDIRASAAKSANKEGMPNAQHELSFAVTDGNNPKEKVAALNPEIAQKAHEMVDKILGEFAFEAQFRAGLKMIGIMLNENQEMMKNFKEREKTLTKDSAGGTKFDSDVAPKEISCEEFVNNPYLKVPKEEVDRINKNNRKQIKEALSGCPSLSAGKFLQCTSDFNRLIALVDEHASCAVQSVRELEKIIDQAIKGKFAELQKSVVNCMFEDFSSCDFKQEEVVKASNPKNKSPHVPKAPIAVH